MEHQIYLFGLNHKTAGVEVREAFALGERPKLGELLVGGEARVREALVLSTCNRVEVLVADAVGRDPKRPSWPPGPSSAAKIRPPWPPISMPTRVWPLWNTFSAWPRAWIPWSWASRRFWAS